MSDDLWGPWIEHDGKGCPCVGKQVEAYFYEGGGDEEAGSVVWSYGASWSWVIVDGEPSCFDPEADPIIRYRIRKPRALLQLIEMVQNLPSHQKEDA